MHIMNRQDYLMQDEKLMVKIIDKSEQSHATAYFLTYSDLRQGTLSCLSFFFSFLATHKNQCAINLNWQMAIKFLILGDIFWTQFDQGPCMSTADPESIAGKHFYIKEGISDTQCLFPILI